MRYKIQFKIRKDLLKVIKKIIQQKDLNYLHKKII